MSDGGFGSGGFFGRVGSDYGPSGQYGAWPGCGCSSLLIIIAGMFLVCGGFMRMFNF